MADAPPGPPPVPNPETQAYWDAAAEGRLLIRRCEACGQPHHYPRATCPHCLGADLAWVTCTGRGRIYSFSIARQRDPAYVIAYVRLEEGVTLMTNIVDCVPEAVRIDQPVHVVFRPSQGGVPVPMFTPDAAAEPDRA